MGVICSFFATFRNETQESEWPGEESTLTLQETLTAEGASLRSASLQ